MAPPVNLHRCRLAAAAAPLGCDWCGRPLTRRQRRWCSELCRSKFAINHFWDEARAAALKRDGYQCIRCGRHTGLEVNHIHPVSADPRRGKPYGPGCQHHLENLEVLCHTHHLEATAKQRAEGLLGRGRKR